MAVVKLVCTNCGKEFVVDVESYSVNKLKDLPKRCPTCIDDNRELLKVVLNRELIKEYYTTKESVEKVVRQLPVVGESGNYTVFGFGGRDFGKHGGAQFSERYLIFVHKDIASSNVARIRLMKKVWRHQTTQRISENLYVAIDPAIDMFETVEPLELVMYCAYDYKYTLKGFGRQYKTETQLIGEYDTLLTTFSGYRSGRAGNTFILAVAKPGYEFEIKHEED